MTVQVVKQASRDSGRRAQGFSYVPALDGVRAVAIIVTMAYHGGVLVSAGGYYGVDTFFVLSGFLITSLLVTEWEGSGSVRLGAFWARRAKRLLPALLVVLLAVAAYAEYLVPKGTYPTLRSDGLAALFYFANWHDVAIGANYFAQSGLGSPLSHTWSLAIEEQFYLIWPLILLVVFKVTKSKRLLLALCVLGAAASALEMGFLYSPASLNRLYYGSDSRAQSILVGAALAVALSLWLDRRRSQGSSDWEATTFTGRTMLLVVGMAGIVGSAVIWRSLSITRLLAFRGGFLLASLATAGIILSVCCSRHSFLAKASSFSPLRYIGRISYGMYLWHVPLFLYLDSARTGLEGYPLFAVRAAATVIIAAASFHLIENPIRRGTFLRGWRGLLSAPVAVLGTGTVLIAATVTPAAATGDGSLSASQSRLAVAAGPTARVLLVGDSMAQTLGNGVVNQAALYFGIYTTLGSGIDGNIGRDFGLNIINDATPNCGLAVGDYKVLWNGPEVPSPPCRKRSGEPGWAEDWSRIVTAQRPAVSVFLARLDIVDRLINGHWTYIGQRDYDNYLLRQLRLAVRTLSSRGGKVILLTTPYYSTGEQADGRPWPEDNPARVNRYNALLRQVASEYPKTVFVVDLNRIVDPNGHYQPTIDGVRVRYSDGAHLTTEGDCWLAPRLLPLIRQIAIHHRPASRAASAALVREAIRQFPSSRC